ncbi:hypothetical protein BTHI11S_04728 [Bosea thiooxidans]
MMLAIAACPTSEPLAPRVVPPVTTTSKTPFLQKIWATPTLAVTTRSPGLLMSARAAASTVVPTSRKTEAPGGTMPATAAPIRCLPCGETVSFWA